MAKKTPVEGQTGLYRDENSGAIIILVLHTHHIDLKNFISVQT